MDGQHTPDRRVAAVASRQYSLISRRQARDCGLTDAQIDVRVRTGRWLVRGRGVFQLAGGMPGWRVDAMAAVLAGPNGTVASFVTALAAHRAAKPSPRPHVILPRSSSGRIDVAITHRIDLPPQDKTVIEGLPCTTVERSVVDSAMLLSRRSLEAVVDTVLVRPGVNADDIVAAARRAGRRRHGVPLLLSVLDAWSTLIEPGSPAEVRALRLLEQWGYGRPVTQHVVHSAGGIFLARLDLAWPDDKVGLEYDTSRWHGPRRWDHDELRYAALKELGWAMVGMDKRDLMPGDRRLRDSLDAAFRAQRSATLGRDSPSSARFASI